MLKVDILGAPETAASVLYGIYDTLMLPGTAWPMVVLDEPADPLVRVRIVAKTNDAFECRGGVLVSPHLAITEANDAEVICVPNMTIPPDHNPRGRYREEVAWLKRRYHSGTTIASVCSGAVLLAEAGLLEGEQATAHWAYREMFRNYYPNVDFRPERVLSYAGDEDRIILAGGITSWQDLALYVIARFLGPEHAVQASKFYLISGHDEGQLPYAAIRRRIQKSDQAISECQVWLAQNYAKSDIIPRLLRLSGLNRRTFSRRFKAATGYSAIEYLQALRVEEAKQLLEASALSIDAIAEAVGYKDEGAFRRTFVKKSGLSPSAYRKKFGHARFRKQN